MTKLELTAKVLLNQIEAGENTLEVIKDGLKSYAADSLNLLQLFRDKNLDPETIREMMEQHGLDFNGKTKKYS